MSLTFIGLVQLVLGSILLARGSLNWLLVFMLLSSLMIGSAAVQLPAIGGSSIRPLEFALIFLAIRVFAPRGGYASALPAAAREHATLILFVMYGVAAAIAAPRVFAGEINVAPMRLTDVRDIYEAIPLAPTPQNVTAAVYLVGTMTCALMVHIVCTFRGGANTLVRTGVCIAWLHGLLGLFGMAVRGTPVQPVFDLFRNASYAQLDHAYQGFVRLTGLAPEASSFAAFGLAWFVFNAECWYRGVLPRSTGRAALFLAGVLAFSTSSTAYIGLAVYALFFILRVAAFPTLAPRKRVLEAAAALFATTFLTAILLATVPSMPAAMWDMLLHMTVEKQDSISGQQRTYWAMQGWHAFLTSAGLGIGPGSFRSSSQIMAVLGSMGLIGLGCYLLYLWQVLQPHRSSTWAAAPDPALSVGAAAGTTAVLILIPAAFIAPSPDPGTEFAIFAGAALGLRPRWLRASPAPVHATPRLGSVPPVLQHSREKGRAVR